MPANHKIIVYQLLPRLFGNQNTTNEFYGSIEQNGCGKFNDINIKALKSLKDFGITHVWYTGIIEHATMTSYAQQGITADNPLVVKGRAGSPYAVKDYYDVDPDLAINVSNRMAEFESLVGRTKKQGLKIFIDFIPNHVAREYKSDVKPEGIVDFGEKDDSNLPFSASNNFYYLPWDEFHVPDGVSSPVGNTPPYVENPAKATGNDVFSARPSIYDWYETVKLNYGVDYRNGRATYFSPIPATWLQMKDILLFWLAKGIDGFRCDMVEMVPVEFWGWVIDEIQTTYPDAIFIGEVYNPALYRDYIFRGKFTYLYDKVGLYDSLRRLMEGGGNADDITRVWQNESGEFSEHMLRFLENHDEQRIASEFFAGDPDIARPSWMLSATLHNGPLMIYSGQEIGVSQEKAEGFHGHDGRTTIFDYWGLEEWQKYLNKGKYDGTGLSDDQSDLRLFYQKVNIFVQSNVAITNGHFYDLQYANNNWQSYGYNSGRIYSYLRHTNEQILLFVINFDHHTAYNTFIKIPSHAWIETLGFSPDRFYQFREIFSEANFTFEMNGADVMSQGIHLNLEPLVFYVLEINGK